MERWCKLGGGWRGAAIVVAMGVLLSGLYFRYEQRSMELHRFNQREMVIASLLAIMERLEFSLNNRLFLTHSIESYVHAREGITDAEFLHLAESLLRNTDKKDLRSLQIARGTTIEHVYPVRGNEGVLGLDLLSLPGQVEALQRTIEGKRMVLAGPLELVQGGKAVVARKPIFVEEGEAQEYWGLATVIIDWDTLLNESGIANNEGLKIALRGKDGLGHEGAIFFGSSEVFSSMPVMLPVTIPGGDWIIAATPVAGWDTTVPNQGSLRTFAALIILVVLLSIWLLTRYPLILREKIGIATRELESSRDALEQRVEERTAQLVESEQRMRRLISALPFPVAVTAVEGGKYLYANEPAAELFEETLEDQGQSALNYYEIPEQRQRMLEQLQRDGSVLGFEVALKSRKGKSFWGLLSAVPIVYDQQQALLVAITDITERKKMEMALAESERTLRTILDSVQTPMAIARRSDGVVLRLNAASKRLSGITDEHIGVFKAHDIYCSSSDRENLVQQLDRNGSVHDLEVCMHSLDGEEKTMLLSATYIDYENEPCILSSHTEITQRKRVELALQKANREAEQAMRSKNEFLATMSHEIRTPLNGVLTMLRLLSHTELTPKQREYVAAINYSGESLLTILNDVLDLSKLEAGMLKLVESDFDLRGLIDDMVRMTKSGSEQSRVRVYHNIDNRIPYLLRGDSMRLRQVLFNLLGNAIKFTEEGEVELKASYLYESKGGVSVKFSIRDTGIGIPEQAQGSLFESFTQADSSVTRQYGGTGLGLAICRRMVEIMGGEIGVVSEEGKGSEFWFRLVLARAGGAGTGEVRASPAAEADRLPTLKVLLVEDDAINRRAGSALLRHEGADVVTAADGYEALERFREGGFDVVLMDIRMPGMDGLETTRRLRALDGGADVPVVALTADATQDNVERCLEVGMSAVITKPIRFDRLREALASLDVGAVKDIMP